MKLAVVFAVAALVVTESVEAQIVWPEGVTGVLAAFLLQ